MSREIKFRAWDKFRNKMLDDLPTADGVWLNDIQDFYDCKVFMQYTGLKDKKGVEIYENDILSNDNGYLLKVVFEDGQYIALSLTDPNDTDVDLLFNILTEYYVIGNIYENPELLEKWYE